MYLEQIIVCCFNLVAERVNGVFKTDFYLERYFRNINQVRQVVKEMVAVHNHNRLHASCDYLTPEQAHQQHGVLKKRWRPYKSKTRTHDPQQIGEDAKKALEQILVKYSECNQSFQQFNSF